MGTCCEASQETANASEESKARARGARNAREWKMGEKRERVEDGRMGGARAKEGEMRG